MLISCKIVSFFVLRWKVITGILDQKNDTMERFHISPSDSFHTHFTKWNKAFNNVKLHQINSGREMALQVRRKMHKIGIYCFIKQPLLVLLSQGVRFGEREHLVLRHHSYLMLVAWFRVCILAHDPLFLRLFPHPWADYKSSASLKKDKWLSQWIDFTGECHSLHLFFSACNHVYLFFSGSGMNEWANRFIPLREVYNRDLKRLSREHWRNHDTQHGI